ncbi:hypothetical protein PACTADRAFT_1927 [Pachysolen tannophilus NRRL Y-2460]|uniref:Uncharacterized protein n=1 Tax=Pachysolen tannophilus NRRL Y-2460 TaxID=669874 RepID=A0A1E4U043_PACTA|nr:hypothetical protein PACTADRAFT_1927 [Pachysolen tannophilus NRRL Y-2460]
MKEPRVGNAPYKKRRSKSNAVQQQQQAHQQAPISAPPPAIEEISIHDEIDVLSYRHEVSRKLIGNQELLENVTQKYFTIDSIVPPKSLPDSIIQGIKFDSSKDDVENKNQELLERENLILRSKLNNLLPNDIILGDIKLMNLKLRMLEEENLSLKNELDESEKILVNEEYEYQFKKSEELRKSFINLNGADKYEEQTKLVEDIMNNDYKYNFKKIFHKEDAITQFSQPNLYNNRITAASVASANLAKQKELEQQQQQQQQEQQAQQQQQQLQQTDNMNIQDNNNDSAIVSPFQPAQSRPSSQMAQSRNHFLSNASVPLQQQQPQPQQAFIPQDRFQLTPQQSFNNLVPQINQQAPPLQQAQQQQPQQQQQQQAPPVSQPQKMQQLAQQQNQNTALYGNQLDSFGILPPNDFTASAGNDDLLKDDGSFNGLLQSTLDDQVFFDHKLLWTEIINNFDVLMFLTLSGSLYSL